jgi:hypothetical protein
MTGRHSRKTEISKQQQEIEMKMKMRREDQGTVFLSFPFSPTRGPAGKIPPPLVDLIYNVFGPFSFKTLN